MLSDCPEQGRSGALTRLLVFVFRDRARDAFAVHVKVQQGGN